MIKLNMDQKSISITKKILIDHINKNNKIYDRKGQYPLQIWSLFMHLGKQKEKDIKEIYRNKIRNKY